MKLIKLDKGLWRLVDDGFSIEGNWAFIYAHMLYERDIELDEINFAVDEMRAKHHDTAHFGVGLTCTHTSSSSLAKQVAIQLEAIEQVKRELVRAYKVDKHGAFYRDAQKRLMYLAMTLDASGALKVIAGDTGKLAA